MIISSAEFVKSAVKPAHYPDPDLPEIAFAGRSNVGKSSLINTLVNRRSLVKTSSTPGRTQLINFFLINKAFTFVDLPGYGYAKVPRSVVKSWGEMIETYLSTRQTLKGVVMLMDIRRTPGQDELNLVNWFQHYGINAVYVLTKADKFSRQQQIGHHEKCAAALGLSSDQLIRFSSKSRMGREQLLDTIQPWTTG
jgi:GTP-binding protein